MAFEVVLPRLGWSMETGKLGEWLKKDGERVQAGDALFTVEGDKAVQEVEALESGILRIPPNSPPPGKELPVGARLAYLLADGEPLPFAPAVYQQGDRPTGAAAGPTAAQPASTNPIRRPQPAPTISPRARRVARELGVDWIGLQGSSRSGRIVERDVRLAAGRAPGLAQPAPAVTPVARRVANDLGVDAVALATQSPGKRIRRADVEVEAGRARSEQARPEPVPPAALGQPLTAVRRLIAERMATSVHTTAPVTLTTEVDATEIVRLRRQLQNDAGGSGPTPSYNDILAKLTAQALLEHPALNARFEGDAIVQATTANIGIAVDTVRGLLVPVLRDVQTKSLRQVAREATALIEQARTGRIAADDLRGGGFTITNLGMYEIDAFTPIINLPECAILGVGRIIPKQVVVDADAETVAIRRMMALSLTFDHRLVDGAPAARFLQRLKQYIEKPYLWLAGPPGELMR